MEKAIDVMLETIDHRGGDATGFVAIGEDGSKTWQKASCKARDFYLERKEIPYRTRSVLMHTRMATQGSPAFPENNHPVRRGSVFIVHNGHVWNDKEIFRKTRRDRYGQVDSEAIAAIIAKYGIMRTHKAMEEISGAAAIGVVDETRPGVMALARGSSSPLMFYANDDVAVFGSIKWTITKAWEILYGTAPKDKNIIDVDEGVAIYLDDGIEVEKFKTDDYFKYVSSTPKKTTYVSSTGKTYSWDEWEEDKDSYLSGKESDKYGSYYGKALILCEHGVTEEDCDICNPDDENGSFLPVLREGSDDIAGWIPAAKCDLCSAYVEEEDIIDVEDMDDKWSFCKDCAEEMGEVISECAVNKNRATTIHSQTLEEWTTGGW